jgi:hypothetical protein
MPNPHFSQSFYCGVTESHVCRVALNLNSDIAFTENPISFGVDTLKREVSTSPKLALL